MEMCFNGSVVMGEIIVERSAGTLVEQLPAGQSILLTPRRPLGKKLEWKKYFQHFWTSPQERDTWWWHHIHMELWGMRPIQRGARRGQPCGADRIMQACIDAAANEIMEELHM